MRKLFFAACIISTLIVAGSFVFSKWHASKLEPVVVSEQEPIALRSTEPHGTLDPEPIPSNVRRPGDSPVMFQSDDSDQYGLNLAGLTEDEARPIIIKALGDAIREAEAFLADWEAKERAFEGRLRGIERTRERYAELQAEALAWEAEHKEIDGTMRASLPDGFDYDHEMTLIAEQLAAGESQESIVARLVEKLNALEPTPEPRPGGLPAHEFDPNNRPGKY